MAIQENMANLWQQAETNSGALSEVTKMVAGLHDRLITAPADKANPSTPVRAGLIGVLDSQANDIRDVRDVLSALIDYVGERGAAPVSTQGAGYSTEAKRAR